MITLIIVLNKVDYLDEVLSTLVKFKVRGATILDSQGMGGAIVSGGYRNIPLFGSLRTLINEKHPYNKTIFSVVKEEIIEDLVKAINDVFDEKQPGTGFMFTLPVINVYPMDK